VLARIFDADAPLAELSSHTLDGIDRVVLQRSERFSATRTARELILGIADPRMSEHHAELVWLADRWELRDLQSKNGVRVGGAPVTRRALVPGDIFECGRTFFALTAPVAIGEPRDRIVATDTTQLATFDPDLAAALATLDRAAASEVAVGIVIVGETGTGKEVVARAIHARSGRSGAFVALDAGALPPELIEGTLFGHVRGAFSDATTDQLRTLRTADRGTLFLDELADLPPRGQSALLRALQEHAVVPLGTTRPILLDLRIVVATQRPLDALVAGGTLRADLAHRLAGVVLELPALRDRCCDLGFLVATLLRRIPDASRPARFAPAAVRALLAHPWPGNVRELEKCLAVAAVHAGTGTVEAEHLALATPEAAPLSDSDRGRRQELVACLAEHRGNISAVARALGKDRVQIRRWLERFALDPDAYRG